MSDGANPAAPQDYELNQDQDQVMPFGARTAQALRRHIHLYRPKPVKPNANRVFLSLVGYPMTLNGRECIVKHLQTNSGVAKLHALLLHHTFAVKCLANGGAWSP